MMLDFNRVFVVCLESPLDEPIYRGDFFACLAYMRKIEKPDKLLCFDPRGILFAYRGAPPRGMLAEAEASALEELRALPEFGKKRPKIGEVHRLRQ